MAQRLGTEGHRVTRRRPPRTLATDAPVEAHGPAHRVVRSPGRPRDERVSRAITEAAVSQLDSLGYGGLTLESVAKEAGVSRATIYRRYRDKGDLVTAAIASRVLESPAPDAGTDPRQALVRYLEEFDEHFAESCLEVIGGLIGSREEPHALELHRQRVVGPRREVALGLLAAARCRGELDASADLDLAWQMLAGSVLFRRVSGQGAGPDWAARAVEAVWEGMGARD